MSQLKAYINHIIDDPRESFSMQPLSISFHNFSPGTKQFIIKSLGERYDVSVERCGKDIEFYGVFGEEFPKDVHQSKALKVWITGENRDPRHIIYDLHFGFHQNTLLGDRSIRFPLWVFYINWWNKTSLMSPARLMAPRHLDERPRFCNFICSKDMSFRAEVFHRLSERRHVDSLGGVLNNVGGRVGSKMDALKQYRFTLAFENILAFGYVTEKILQPLAAGSIPIYWGASEAKKDFNPDSFIDATQFNSVDSLIDYVLTLADDPVALKTIAEAPIFSGPIPYEHTPTFFIDRIEQALSDPRARGHGRAINETLAPMQTTRVRLKSWSRRIRGRA